MYTENLSIATAANRVGISFSNDAIHDQLDRIFLNPCFLKSTILKNFLLYVVNETLTGNAGYLKEYTIAVKVLQKPPTFDPQKDGIVRIHAVRLRNALSQYYSQAGNDDEIIIGIPKGKYVPVFVDRKCIPQEEKSNHLATTMNFPRPGRQTATFAILPLACMPEKHLKEFAFLVCEPGYGAICVNGEVVNVQRCIAGFQYCLQTRSRLARARSLEDRVDAVFEFLNAERLADIVVGANLESADAVIYLTLGC